MHSTLPSIALMLVLFVASCAGCWPKPIRTDAEKELEVEKRYATFRSSFPEVRDLSIAEFLSLSEHRPLLLVDVRPEMERRVSMIPGSISKDSFEKHQKQYHESLIVSYCTIGARSGHYAAKLQREGFEAVNLRGSILAWTHAGQPLVDQQGPTKRVHVYSSAWDLLPAGFEAVW